MYFSGFQYAFVIAPWQYVTTSAIHTNLIGRKYVCVCVCVCVLCFCVYLVLGIELGVHSHPLVNVSPEVC
jgi:hypothetical protein